MASPCCALPHKIPEDGMCRAWLQLSDWTTPGRDLVLDARNPPLRDGALVCPPGRTHALIGEERPGIVQN
jgi:hypothetical protein